jgi:hypothetical protein
MMKKAAQHDLWARDEVAALVRPIGPISPEDALENHCFRLGDSEHGKNDPKELVDRVRRGVKPMATIHLRAGRRIQVGEASLKQALAAMGMECLVVPIPGTNRVEAVVYQPGLTLADFYCKDEIVARYKVIGVTLSEDVFSIPLETLASSLAREDFSPDSKLPIMGLCFGYPVSTTLELLRQR